MKYYIKINLNLKVSIGIMKIKQVIMLLEPLEIILKISMLELNFIVMKQNAY